MFAFHPRFSAFGEISISQIDEHTDTPEKKSNRKYIQANL